ncbi:MAG TPA: phage holin family protein [Thermoanaerobaculia bacterium]|nr:phage holin family protein [Thermoanaerobaculia bacterium]
MLDTWLGLFRSLGTAYLDLLRAEWAEVRREIAVSAKRLAVGVALLGAAAAVGFWFVAVAIYLVIVVLALWLPQWAAVLVVTVLLLAVIAVLALVGMKRLQKVESPTTVFARRYDDHLDWWHDRLLAQGEREPLAPETPRELL